jgi:transcriptional regulator with XRE-family HTH domain
MKERIIEFLKRENKSSAQFALEIGVQPSSISHIISGRNNPSLDFIMKMLSKYSDLSADWLLFGKGQMSRETTFGDLFDAQSITQSAKSAKVSGDPLISKNLVDEDIYRNEPEIDKRKGPETNSGKVKRIICFFGNNTFTEYFPSDE